MIGRHGENIFSLQIKQAYPIRYGGGKSIKTFKIKGPVWPWTNFFFSGNEGLVVF